MPLPSPSRVTDTSLFFNMPDGQEVEIAKAGLSPDLLSQMESAPPESALPPQAPPGMPPVAAPAMPPAPGVNPPTPIDLTTPLPPQPVGSAPHTAPPVGGQPSINMPSLIPSAEAAEGAPNPGDAVFANANQALDTPAAPQPPNVSRETHGIDQSFDAQQKAIKQGADAQAQNYQDQAAVMADHEQKLREQQEFDQAARDQYTKDMAGQQKVLDESIAETQTPIDKRRWWKNSKGYQKVGAAIAVALGAIGQTLQGSDQNTALDAVMGHIDKDIDEQMANLESKKAGAKLQFGAYDRMRQKFGDEEQARAATRMALIDQTKARIETMAAQTNSEVAKANAANTIAQLDEKRAETKIAFDQKAEQLASKRGLSYDAYVPGAGMAVNKDAAKKARTAKAQYEEVANTLGELKAWRKDAGFGTMTGMNISNKAEGKSKAVRAQIALKKLAEMGASYSENEQKMIESLVPKDPSDWGFVQTRLEQAEKLAQEKYKAIMRSHMLDFRGLPEEQVGFQGR